MLREFYKEKDVIMEERRMMENQPTGRLYEEFQGIAYLAHPYGEGVIGHMSDIQTITRPEAEAFFKAHYGPSNLTIAIVGDVDPAEVKRLAEKYFAGIPSAPKPEPVETEEPPQRGERRVTIEDAAQPVVLIGYHQPNVNHADYAALEVISQIVGVGRTSRLYKDLVKDKKIAVSANARADSSKYPSLFMFFVVPAKGHTNSGMRASGLCSSREAQDRAGLAGRADQGEDPQPGRPDPAARFQFRPRPRADVL